MPFDFYDKIKFWDGKRVRFGYIVGIRNEPKKPGVAYTICNARHQEITGWIPKRFISKCKNCEQCRFRFDCITGNIIEFIGYIEKGKRLNEETSF